MKRNGLSEHELKTAAEIIRLCPPGVYTLVELYGKQRWERMVSRPKTFGSYFKAAVIEGKLQGIEVHPDFSPQRANQYVIDRPE